MVPFDVLIDPLSLPSHPVIQEKQNMDEVLFGEELHERPNLRDSENIRQTKSRQTEVVKQ